jgi:hypothetical protein
MASVWEAEDTVLGRRVAVKVISDTLAHDERWLARFRREARAAASISHPNVVKVFDFGVEEDRPYIVMAHASGGTLRERLAGNEPLVAAGLARELLGALGTVHAAGILHRDVKPANILLDREGRSHLTDFGIARPEDATSMTQTGVVLGTARYLAPEVAAGEPATPASDLYAAGVVLREAAREDPALAPLVDALTREDPAQRPQSAQAALALLDGAPATTETRAMPEADRAEATTRRQGPDTGAANGEAADAGAADGEAPDAGTTYRPPADTSATRRMAPTVASMGPGAVAPLRLAELAELRRSPWFAPAAAIAAVVLVAIVVIVVASSGGGAQPPAAAPTPAPLSAPPTDQLDTLDRAIDHAAGTH